MQNKFKSPIKKAQIGGMTLPNLGQLPSNLKKAAPRIEQIQREKAMLLPGVTPLPTDFKGVVSMKPANENVQPTYAASQAGAFKEKIEKGDPAFDYYQHYMTKGNGDQMMGAILGNWIKSRRNKKEFNRLNEIDNKNRAQAEQRAKMQSAINKGLNIKNKNDAAVVTKEFKDKNDKIREVIIGDMNKPAIQAAVNKLDDKGNVPGTNVTPAQTIASKSEPVVTPQAISSANAPLKSAVNNLNKTKEASKKTTAMIKNASGKPSASPKTQSTFLNQFVPSLNRGVVNLPSTILKTPAAVGDLLNYIPGVNIDTKKFGTRKLAEAYEKNVTNSDWVKNNLIDGNLGKYDENAKWYHHIPEAIPSILATKKFAGMGASKAAPAVAKQAAKQLPAGSVVKQLPAGKPIRVAKDVYQKAANAAKSTSTAKPAAQSVAKPVTKALPVGKTPSNVYGKPTPKSPNLPNMQPKRIPQNASPGPTTTPKPPVNTTAAKAAPKKSTATIQNTVAKFRSTIKSARATGDKAKVQKAMKEYQDFKNKYPAANKFQSGGSTNMRENLFNHYYNNM